MKISLLTILMLLMSNLALASKCLVEHKSEPISIKYVKAITFNKNGKALDTNAKNIDQRAINTINRRLGHTQENYCLAIVKTGDISHKEFSVLSNSEIFVYLSDTKCPEVNSIISGSILLSCNVKYKFQIGDTSDGYSHYSAR